jgi:predicted permease
VGSWLLGSWLLASVPVSFVPTDQSDFIIFPPTPLLSMFSVFFLLNALSAPPNVADLSTLIFRHFMMSSTLGANITMDTPFPYPSLSAPVSLYHSMLSTSLIFIMFVLSPVES